MVFLSAVILAVCLLFFVHLSDGIEKEIEGGYLRSYGCENLCVSDVIVCW
jgi:hypothetical protein